jgi:hypothetical protein
MFQIHLHRLDLENSTSGLLGVQISINASDHHCPMS